MVYYILNTKRKNNMQNMKENWSKVLDLLEKEVTAVSFDLWIKSCEPIELKDNYLLIKASSETAKQRIIQMHAEQLKLALAEVFDGILGFEILNPDEANDYAKAKQTQNVNIIDEEIINQTSNRKLNPKYTFDSFVVGKSNQFV